MAAIHPRLQDPAFRFVLLGSHGEALKRPFEYDWQKTANYPYNDPKISAHRGNVGICGGFGDLHILDCDDLKRWEELKILPLLPPTFTVESRPGHRQYYLKCEAHIQSSGLYDPDKTEPNEAGKPEHIHIGDLKAAAKDGICGGQAVTPGSLHPSGSSYQVVVDAPIAEVSRELLQSIISRFKTSKRANTNYQKLEEQAKNARLRGYEEHDPFDSLRVVDIMPPAGNVTQSGDELRGDHPVHGSTNGGNYVINLQKNVWHCKRCESGGGPALAIAVKHRLISCSDAQAGELRGDLFKEVLKIARDQYDIIGNGSIGPKADKCIGNEVSECAPCDIHELVATFKKWLYIKEDYNITAPFAGDIANFCEGSPDIIGIIGPSGSIKTELIRALGETQNEYVYPVSTITEHTLVSGHKDSRDLVPQLKGRILAIKDLTSILARKEDVRAAIFADFRELTDGYIRKEFGNGIAKEYHDIHSSIIFASTNAIERYYSMYSNLGQRMIFIRPENDPKEARKKASENRGKQKEMRAELHAVTMRFIASMLRIIEERGLPTTPAAAQEEMGELYDFLAIARTTIHHDFKTGDIDELPEPEFPTRIANTIGRLCEVHALFYGRNEVNDEDMAFGRRIISDNIPSMRLRVLRSLTREWQHTTKISQVADLPPRSTKYHLDELVALKLAEKLLKDEADFSMDHRFDYFKLSDFAARALEKYDTSFRIEHIIETEQSKIIDKQNISLPNPCVVLSGTDESGVTSKKVEDPKGSKVGEDPGREKFRTGMKKRKCLLCGRTFPYDLGIFYLDGRICQACHAGQGQASKEPAMADPQQRLDGDGSAP